MHILFVLKFHQNAHLNSLQNLSVCSNIFMLSYLTLIQLTKAFTHVRVLIYENFGGYDVAEGQKGRDKVCVAEFLWQMIDKEIATFGTLDLLVRVAELRLLRCRRRSGCSRRERGEP